MKFAFARQYILSFADSIDAIDEEEGDLLRKMAKSDDLVFLSSLYAANLDYACELDYDGLCVKADAVEVRPMVFRDNYDLGEVYPRILDEFRAGKIKGISDFMNKLRRKRSPIKLRKRLRKKRADYCAKEDFKGYWRQLLKGAPHEIIKDFMKYVDLIRCSK